MAAQAIRCAGLQLNSARFVSLASKISRSASPLLSRSFSGVPLLSPGLTSAPHHPGWRYVPRCSLYSHAKSKSAMPVRLGEVIPDLEVTTTKGKYKLQEWVGDGWGAIFSFPAAFTPVCTTELAVVAKYQAKFKERDVKLMGVTIESPDNQDFGNWLKDVETYAETKIEFPVAFDPSRAISDKLNLLDLENLNGEGNPMNARGIHIIRPDKKVRAARPLVFPLRSVSYFPLRSIGQNGEGNPMNARGIHIICPDEKVRAHIRRYFPHSSVPSFRSVPSELYLNGSGNPMNARGIQTRPDKEIRLTLLYPGPVGRNFDEIIRCIAALQLNWKLHVATPANWKIGDRVIVPLKISDEEAEKRGIKNIKAEDLPSKKKYLRWGEAEVLTKI
ncbi:hypothetical protein KFL_001090295 [Klebsormidium nitens]|uniref:thioredoxin-dependent peroxiredoxin n=1 Tax=Klebsormidium nitens TaxID=105231 RepID=A0A1Y1HX80_KLENI|nr:hypothetical protein KFL_001090295 [Klebsormidium nitens]|eukprot:GAQ82382.1 hypothetical protein KFL_001090295 [Klebsormidium nitens]